MEGIDAYDSVLSMIGNTPIVRLNKINAQFQKSKIYAKLEGKNPSGSIKDRIAMKMIEEAIKDKTLKKGMTIIEATSGNTGIGLAMIGATLGYKVLIVMSEGVSEERRSMIRSYGANILLTDAKKGTDGAIIKVRELLKQFPDKYFTTDQFNNKWNMMSHYMGTGPEIYKQMKGNIDYVVISIGTSGTIMGIEKYMHEQNKDIKIVEAHPIRGHFIQGLKNMKEAIVPGIYKPKNIDISIKVESEDAFNVAREIILKEGISVGMSSGAACWTAIEIAKRIEKGELKPGNIVVIFPDRGEKYLSTVLFEEYKKNLSFDPNE